MGRTVDLDDLLDTADVADLLGWPSATAVATYRQRAADTGHPFPDPIRQSRGGRCQLWHRADIEAWATARRSS